VGSKLPVLAAVIAISASARAETPAELTKRGIDLYKAGKFAEAVPVLAKAYDADPKPDTLFPLAQAERQAGDCTAAVGHYKKLLGQISDFNVAKLVQQNLALCEKPGEPAAPACEATPGEPAKPVTVTKTVVRNGGSDKLATGLAVVGTLALGVAGGLAVAAQSSVDASNKANSLDAHNSFADRATLQSGAAIGAAVVGVAAFGYAVFRWTSHKPAADVAVAPTPGGGAVWVSGRF